MTDEPAVHRQLADTLSVDLGPGRWLPRERASAAWLREHGPLQEFRVPTERFDDGTASATLECSIDHDYLWYGGKVSMC